MSYEDDHGFHGALMVRAETPTMEDTTRLQIEEAVRLLVETKTLYQNVEVDVQPLEKELEPIGERIRNHYVAGRTKGGATDAKITRISQESEEMWAKRKAAVLAEVPHRLWRLKTLHLSDDPQHHSIIAMASRGLTQPLETPIEDREIVSWLPRSSSTAAIRVPVEAFWIWNVGGLHGQHRGVELPLGNRLFGYQEKGDLQRAIVGLIFLSEDRHQDVSFEVGIMRSIRVVLGGFTHHETTFRALRNALQPPVAPSSYYREKLLVVDEIRCDDGGHDFSYSLSSPMRSITA